MTGKSPPELRILTSDELDAILIADDLGTEVVAMPEWGTGIAVRIRGLSMEDIYRARAAIAEAGVEGAERDRIRDREWLLAAILEPKLTAAQAEKLIGKSADAVLRLINRINALNGASQEVAERLAGEFPAKRVA
jgi:hypothetical protein